MSLCGYVCLRVYNCRQSIYEWSGAPRVAKARGWPVLESRRSHAWGRRAAKDRVVSYAHAAGKVGCGPTDQGFGDYRNAGNLKRRLNKVTQFN